MESGLNDGICVPMLLSPAGGSGFIAASVLLHGLTAAPLAGRMARWWESHPRGEAPLQSGQVTDVPWRQPLRPTRPRDGSAQERPSSRSAIRSPTTTAGTFVFARGTTGINEQSATVSRSRP